MIAGPSGVALFAVAAALALDAGHAHRVTIDHHRGAVEADYRSRVAVTHRQIGAVAPGGAASTLRCAWQAHLVVDRTARGTSGATLSRTFRHENILSGTRAGWCTGAAPAIAREVAARYGDLRAALHAAAAADRATIVAELDRRPAGTAQG